MKRAEIEQSASDRLLDKLKNAPDKIVDWNDGFTPSGCNGAKGRMVIDQPRSQPGLVAIREDVVPNSLAQNLYDSAVEAGVWGEYVSLDEIDSLLPSCSNGSDSNDGIASDVNENSKSINKTLYRRQLAAQAVHSFFCKRFADLIEEDWNEKNVHGVSVWVIASDVGNSVQYHIDYAEMFRFQTNTIYPPMYGGTLHLTNTTGMEGGGFFVHRDGLEHYRKFQYKCPLEKLGWDGTGINTATEQNHSDSKWVEVPYKYNQGTLCDGDLPHFSAPVRSIPEGLKRVIVGFNVCNHEIGPIVQEFPEHSAKFNRFVKLSQTATKTTGFGGGLTVEACKANPKLAAFVKLLARKMKETEVKKNQTEIHPRRKEPSSENGAEEECQKTLESKENNGVTRHP